jgi:hypothetical protein
VRILTESLGHIEGLVLKAPRFISDSIPIKIDIEELVELGNGYLTGSELETLLSVTLLSGNEGSNAPYHRYCSLSFLSALVERIQQSVKSTDAVCRSLVWLFENIFGQADQEIESFKDTLLLRCLGLQGNNAGLYLSKRLSDLSRDLPSTPQARSSLLLIGCNECRRMDGWIDHECRDVEVTKLTSLASRESWTESA